MAKEAAPPEDLPPPSLERGEEDLPPSMEDIGGEAKRKLTCLGRRDVLCLGVLSPEWILKYV